ncbi:hypothetical protein ACOYW6_04215 [Parablastomonas sp. CN1-191]|uniref:hypothetical protein n=1 Tax=Parablastomonas sp. CN1-191 TaxID=3400908 RepID=UPI003BF7900A
MNRAVLYAAGLLAAFPSAGHAAPRMAGFDRIAETTDRVDIKGVGWGQRGRFTLSGIDAAGQFDRTADENSVDGYKRQRGHVRFSMAGAGLSGALTGSCGYGQDSLSETAPVSRSIETTTTVTVRPFNLVCDFTRDGQPAGVLTLRMVPGRTVDIRTLRAGTLRYGGEVLALRSVHTFEGSKMPTAMPLGYMMTRANAEIAAAYFNGGTRTLALPKAGPAREAALMAGVALTLMWDPGDGD